MTKIKKNVSKQHEEGKEKMACLEEKPKGQSKFPPAILRQLFCQLAIHHIFITMKAKDKKKMS